MACVLVVSSDQSTVRALERFMVFQGHLTLIATGLSETMEVLQQWQVDVLFCDMVGPQEQQEAMQLFVKTYPLLKDTHIIFLTWAESQVRDLLRPELDDFLMKPVSPRQFEEKLYRLLGSSTQGCSSLVEHALHCGPIALDTATFQASVSGRPVSLTPTELALLQHLMHRAGQVATVDELLEAVWGYAPSLGSAELVRVHIKNLRRKLEGKAEGDFSFIKTVPGHGYLMPAEPGDSAVADAA